MCLGIPMQVVSLAGQAALCRGRNGEESIDVSLIGAVVPGEWLLTFLGAARGRLDEAEAECIERALAGLEAVERGEPFDAAAFFPDLVDREPQLPEFLRGKA